MAFSSCLKCHSWTHSRNLDQPFPLTSKPRKFPFPQHRKMKFSSLLASNSSPTSTTWIAPDFTTKQLLETLRRENNENSAFQLFEWASKQPNFTPTLPLYEEVLRKLGIAGSFDMIGRILDDMKRSRIEIVEGTFFILIDSYAKFGFYDEAIGVLDMMENEFGVKPGTHSYNSLLNVLVDGNKLILVETVHSRMSNKDVKPDVSTFNILIKALCKAHQIRPAILMMEEMPNYGLVPDEKTYTTVIQGYIEEGDMKGALRVKEQMEAARCPWSNVTINVLINGFCKECRIEEALIFVEEMANEGFCPDKFTFNTLINGLCKVGHVKHAVEILDLMLQEGFDPDVFTYNTVISGLCKMGAVQDAMEILNQMFMKDCSPNTVTYNTIISTLCKENQVQEATELARILTSKGILPDVSTFNSLIQGLCLTSNFSIGMELFREMSAKGCQPDEFTYNILIDCLCSKGKLDQALQLLKDMESSGCARNVVTYNTLIDGFCKSKKLEEAEEIFDLMELQGVSRNLVTYNTLIDGFMVNDELLLEGFKKCKSLGAVAMVHAENGDAVFEGQKRMIELGITGPEGHALSRPPMLEGEATSRAIRLAGFVNTPLYVVHVMSIDAIEEIARARKSGQRVIGEPIVAGLALDDSGLWDPDFKFAAKFVMSPPIRGPGHGKALRAALSTGILQLVGTDHCSLNSTQKALGIDDFRKIPNGVNGIEERMHIVWDSMVVSGLISVTDYVRLTSTECARIFNIYPRKGAIFVGSDADIIILNPNSSFEISSRFHHSRIDTNVYEGLKGKGKVEITIAGGRIVWENDELKIVPGTGKYIKMPPFSYLFDGMDKIDFEYLSSLRAPVKRFKATS